MSNPAYIPESDERENHYEYVLSSDPLPLLEAA